MASQSVAVLVVDDEAHQRKILGDFLRGQKFEAETAESGASAISLIQKDPGRFGVVITDLTMPEMGGIELITKAKAAGCDANFIVLTGNASLQAAIDALKAGATDFLLKPVNFDEMELRLRQIIKMRNLEEETRWLKSENKRLSGATSIVSKSPVMQKILEELKRVLTNNVTVLLTGPTGAGKEVIARYLHDEGPRANGPFVAINCSAIPENLTESHFFGHEKGAFTGAEKRTPGCFERADGGTLFLDEVGEMDLKLQPKILRVLEDRQVLRVGGAAPVNVDVRIVAATNRDLKGLVTEGKFREDLLYRLNVVHVVLPPLKDRIEDLPFLVHSLVERHSKALNIKISGVDDSYVSTLKGYSFPGNVRELSNIVERSLLYVKGGRLGSDSLPGDFKAAAAPSSGNATVISGSLNDMLEKYEKQVIEAALTDAANDVEKAAKRLGVSRSTLYSKISKRGGVAS